MSTKVYTGFMFSNPGIVDVHKALRALQPLVKKIVDKRVNELFAVGCVRARDGRIQLEGEKCPLPTAVHFLHEVMRKAPASVERSPAFDFNFQVTVFPIHPKGMLGMYFAEQQGFSKLIKQQAWFREYAYWDNTDRPEHVSARDWDNRRALWDAVLGYGTPANCGFNMDLHPQFWWCPIPNVKDIVKLLRKGAWPECTIDDLVGKQTCDTVKPPKRRTK